MRCLSCPLLIAATVGLLGCEATGESDKTKVPNVLGQNAAAAEGKLDAANLTASFRNTPLDDKACRVVAQKQRAGTEVDRYSDVDLRCVVAVPKLVGRKADPAQSKLSDLGFESRLRNEPSDSDLSRCTVAGQSKTGAARPGASVALKLACEAAPPPPAPEPTPEEAAPAGNCDPNYDPCVPPFPPDVDCAEVDGPVTVKGDDPHGLDRDGDGSACE